MNKFQLPDLVAKKLSGNSNTAQIIDNLKVTIKTLETRNKIKLLKSLSGGTSAFLATAITKKNQDIVVKIPLPEMDLGVDFTNEIAALKMVAGNGYVKLLAYESELKVAFLEKLGKPLGDCGFSINRQIEIICNTLKQSWLPLKAEGQFPNTLGIADWFTTYINDTWKELHQPFSIPLLTKTNEFIIHRKKEYSPQNTFLVHGDAHNYNILQEKISTPHSFKLIDPDGIRSEPAYDLGVLMREWADELSINPKEKLLERLELLVKLTGLEKVPIWQWGLIQCVATGLVLLQANQEEEGHKLLEIAECWKDVSLITNG